MHNNAHEILSSYSFMTADEAVSFFQSEEAPEFENENIVVGDNQMITIILEHKFETVEEFPALKERVRINDVEQHPASGIVQDELKVEYETTANIKIVESKAGYKNTLGAYTVAEDGTIQNVKILTDNVKDHIGETVNYNLAEGGEMSMFIVANGYNKNKNLFETKGKHKDIDLSEGEFSFVYKFGKSDERPANINDDAKNVSLVFDNGEEIIVINGHLFHTTEQGANSDINSDGRVHAVSGLTDEGGQSVLRVGFEDLYKLGDADFNDVVLDVTFDTVSVQEEAPTNDDVITGDAANQLLIGGEGDDYIYGNRGNDTIYGNEGADHLYGGSHNDVLYGGIGDDFLYGQAGDDILFGDDGNDELLGQEGNDILNGGDGDDLLLGGDGDDLLNGGAGNDTLRGEGGNDILNGDAGNDRLEGGDGSNTLNGGDGNDVIIGLAGMDTIDGGAGDDNINAGADDDIVSGGSGSDRILGEAGNDILNGDAGNDFVYGGQGGDIINGGDGEDRLYGDADNDIINGGAGNDFIYGGTGNDVLYAGQGADRLEGGDGDDILISGQNQDVMIGGAGNDTFVFIDHGDGAKDQIFDFGAGDMLDVTDIISGFDPLNDDIADFVRLRESGGNTLLNIDADGGADGFQTFAILKDVTGLGNASDLYSNGQILTNTTTMEDLASNGSLII